MKLDARAKKGLVAGTVVVVGAYLVYYYEYVDKVDDGAGGKTTRHAKQVAVARATGADTGNAPPSMETGGGTPVDWVSVVNPWWNQKAGEAAPEDDTAMVAPTMDYSTPQWMRDAVI